MPDSAACAYARTMMPACSETMRAVAVYCCRQRIVVVEQIFVFASSDMPPDVAA